MPRFDQTGPEGEGSMTGRKMGKCTNFGGRGSSKEADPSTGAEEIVPGKGLGRRAALGKKAVGRGNGRRGGGQGNGLGRGQGLQNRFRGGQQ